MEFEREELIDIIDISIDKYLSYCYDDVEKYTHYISLLLKFKSLVMDNKIIFIGIKD